MIDAGLKKVEAGMNPMDKRGIDKGVQLVKAKLKQMATGTLDAILKKASPCRRIQQYLLSQHPAMLLAQDFQWRQS